MWPSSAWTSNMHFFLFTVEYQFVSSVLGIGCPA